MRKPGYLRLSRKMFNGDDRLWEDSEPFDRRSAWIDLTQYAAWRARERVVKGRPVQLGRGEFVASIRFLAARWHWGEKRVRLFLAALSDMDRIRAQRETHTGTVYLLVNYDLYQPQGTGEGADKDTGGAQRGHKEEGRKKPTGDKSPSSRIRGDYSPAFEAVWAGYPKRDGDNPKKAAALAWNASVRRGATEAELARAVTHYAAYCRAKGKEGTEYVKQAATFFGPKEPWREYLEPVKARSSGSSNPALVPWTPVTEEELALQRQPTRSLAEFRKQRGVA